jgi:hypothetical protein
MGESRNAYKFLTRKRHGKLTRSSWENNIKINHIDKRGVKWIELAQDMDL